MQPSQAGSDNPKDSPAPELSIIIVSWNTREMLRECLELIPEAAGGLRYEIIVVDNASGDGTPAMLREDFAGVRLIENPGNAGFPKAVNQGITVSSGEFLGLINSDIMLPAQSLKKMVDYLRGHPGIGAVGPQLIGKGGHLQYSGGFAPTPRAALSQLAGFQALYGGRSHGIFVRSRQSGEPMEVDWLSAACMIVRSAALVKAGNMDDSRFMYAEDMEFGLRLQRYGWKLVLLPWIIVVHYGGGSSTGSPAARKLAVAGIFRLAAERLSRPAYILFGLLLSASFMARFVLIKMTSSLPSGRGRINSEVMNHLPNIKSHAKTSLLLSVHEPNFASEFCRGLEQDLTEAASKRRDLN